ncbi:MAG TPA: hypothetical protein OIM34_05195 [Ruminococcus bromii]|nr:hypothetical protein [Ruminococcus bromii]
MGIFNFGKKKQTPEERAEMYYTEGMVLIQNGYYDSAFDVICKASELGHRGAMGQLAMMYIFGQGCEENRNEGINLLRKSVELGNLFSCYTFSVLYDNGIEEISPEEAETMCQIAADAGLTEAIERMKIGFDTEG